MPFVFQHMPPSQPLSLPLYLSPFSAVCRLLSARLCASSLTMIFNMSQLLVATCAICRPGLSPWASATTYPCPFPLSHISPFLNDSAPETNAELMLWLTSPATMDAAWTWPQLHWPHTLIHTQSHANQYQYVRDVICICVNFPCTPAPLHPFL